MYYLEYNNGVAVGISPTGAKCCISFCGSEWRYINQINCEVNPDGSNIIIAKFTDSPDDIFDINSNGYAVSRSLENILYKVEALSGSCKPDIFPMIDHIIAKNVIPGRIYILCGISVVAPQDSFALVYNIITRKIFAYKCKYDSKILLVPCIGIAALMSGGLYRGPFFNVGEIIREYDLLFLKCSTFKIPLIWRDKAIFWQDIYITDHMRPFGLFARSEDKKEASYFAITDDGAICKNTGKLYSFVNLAVSKLFPNTLWSAGNTEFKKVDVNFGIVDPNEYFCHAVYTADNKTYKVLWRQDDGFGAISFKFVDFANVT